MLTGAQALEQNKPPHLQVLTRLEERLTNRFGVLARGREGDVFALEHGLQQSEINELQVALRDHARGPERRFQLCWCVYTAEHGYHYDGLSFWPKLREQTPGWEEDHREDLREMFESFRDDFRGYQPSGAWADHFRNIAWPICHAVLPKDLQRQLIQCVDSLARDELLAAASQSRAMMAHAIRRWCEETSRPSTRFRRLAETDVLAILARALLKGSDTTRNAELDRSVVGRVESDLAEAQQEALRRTRSALKSAQRVAAAVGRVACDGDRRDASSAYARENTLPRRVALRVRPTNTGRGLELWVDIPTLRNTPLGDRVLNSKARLRLIDEERPPSWWTGPRHRCVRLQKWRSSIVEVKGESPKAAGQFGALPELSSFTLLKEAADGEFIQVQTREVRGGNRYLIIVPSSDSAPQGVERVSLACEGVSGLMIQRPASIDAATLHRLRLHILRQPTVRVAGLPAVDRSPSGEPVWLEGDPITLSVGPPQAGMELTEWELDAGVRCLSSHDGLVRSLLVKGGESGWRLVELGVVAPGRYEVTLDLCDGGPIQEIIYPFIVRAANSELASTAHALVVQPPSFEVSLEHLLNCDVHIEIAKPAHASVNVQVELLDFNGRVLECLTPDEASMSVHSEWPSQLVKAEQKKRKRDFGNSCEESVSARLQVDGGRLGNWEMEITRAQPGLRWVCEERARRGGKPASRTVRLCMMDGVPCGSRFYSISTPFASEEYSLAETLRRFVSTPVEDAQPGLYEALAGNSTPPVRLCLPPSTQHMMVKRADWAFIPRLSFAQEAMKLCEVLSIWRDARVFGSGHQRQSMSFIQILESEVKRRLRLTLGGPEWAEALPKIDPESYQSFESVLNSLKNNPTANTKTTETDYIREAFTRSKKEKNFNPIQVFTEWLCRENSGSRSLGVSPIVRPSHRKAESLSYANDEEAYREWRVRPRQTQRDLAVTMFLLVRRPLWVCDDPLLPTVLQQVEPWLFRLSFLLSKLEQ